MALVREWERHLTALVIFVGEHVFLDTIDAREDFDLITQLFIILHSMVLLAYAETLDDISFCGSKVYQ
jgi:hypothetical protein